MIKKPKASSHPQRSSHTPCGVPSDISTPPKQFLDDEKFGEWWTAPVTLDDAQGEPRDGMVTGRADVDKFRENPKFRYLVEITWDYGGDGYPPRGILEQMGEAQYAMQLTFHRDPIAVLVWIATGAGKRVWAFYTLSLPIFRKKINEALSSLPPLPLHFEASDDPSWDAYADMREATEIPH